MNCFFYATLISAGLLSELLCVETVDSNRCIEESNAYKPTEICCSPLNGYYTNLNIAAGATTTNLYVTDLFVTGSTNLDINYTATSVEYLGDLVISGSLTVTSNSIIGPWTTQDLTVNGTAQFSNACADSWCVGGDLSVSGTTFIGQGMGARDICVSQESCMATVTTQTLFVTGSISFDTALSLTITTTAQSIIMASSAADLLISGSITIPGETVVVSDLIIDGDYTISGSACAETILGATHFYAQKLYCNTGAAGNYADLNDYSVLRVRKAIWPTIGKEYAIPGVGVGAAFGSAVAISGRGDVVAISSPTYNTVSIYQRTYTATTTSWTLVQTITLIAPPSSIALSANGNILGIGSATANAATGELTLYIYDDTTNTWLSTQTLGGIAAGELFGSSVSMSASGSSIVVGAPQGNGTTGTVYVFGAVPQCPMTESINWLLQSVINAPAPQLGAQFGATVSISADGVYIAIGEPGRTDTLSAQGAAYVYAVFQYNNWALQQGPILSTTPTLNGRFAQTLALSNEGRYLMIGDPSVNSAALYSKIHYNVWILQDLVTPADGLGASGSCVSLNSDGTVGILSDTTDAASAGGRILVAQRFVDQWPLSYQIVASSATGGDLFGVSAAVSCDGSFVVAGAPGTSGGVGSSFVYSPACSNMPTDLTVTSTLCIGRSTTINGNLFVQGAINYAGSQSSGNIITPCGTCSSDARLKHSVRPLTGEQALLVLRSLSPKRFAWKNPDEHYELGDKPVSLIAQEVAPLMPHWVAQYAGKGKDKSLSGDDGMLLALSYKPDVFAYLVATVRSLYDRLELLEEMYKKQTARQEGVNNDN